MTTIDPEASMSVSLKIIRRVRELLPRKTDYAVAKALGMPQSNLSKVIAGKRRLGPTAIYKAAGILGVDPSGLIAMMNVERARTEEQRSYWGSLCSESLRAALDIAAKTTAATLTAAALIFGSGVPSQARADDLYIMRTFRRWLARGSPARFTAAA